MASTPRKISRPAFSEAAGTDRLFISALARGLDVLRCFDAMHPELGSIELSEMTGLPQPTVWRICHTLVKCGYLMQSVRNGKMRVALGMLSLGHSAIWSIERRELVRQEMQDVAYRSGCAVSLAIPDRGDMLIVERCIPDSMLIVNLKIGSRLPMSSSAMGWAYLAALPPEQRLDSIRALRLPRSPGLAKDIDTAKSSYLKRGFVTNAGRFHPDVNSIAVPIVVQDSGRILAINCGGPASIASMRMLEREIAPRLKTLAGSIGDALNQTDYPSAETNEMPQV